MPPSFLVDEHGQLVDSFGGAESLLQIKARRPSQNLLDMLGDDLRDRRVGRAAARPARRGEPCAIAGVPVPAAGQALHGDRRADRATRTAR